MLAPMPRTVRTLRCIALALAIVPAAAHADVPETVVADLVDRAFRPLLVEHDVPGLAVGVIVQGRPSVFSFGVTSRDNGQPVTAHTLFELGSVSKTFTATLATYAQAQGALALDDHPGRYMPAIRGSAVDRATLLDLGTYTAGGLPLQFPDDVTESTMAAYFRDWQPSAPPGVVRRYSNPSIGLLGHVTGVALGADYADLLEARLFPELGLSESHVRVPEAAMDLYAWGHDKAGAPVRVSPGVLDAEAYGVKSSAADMLRFIGANLRPETLRGPIRRAVESTQTGYVRVGDMVQGLGWERYDLPVTQERLVAGNTGAMVMQANPATPVAPEDASPVDALFNKTGSTNGFGAYVAFVPSKGIGIVMLANRNLPIPARIAASFEVLRELGAVTR